MNTAVMTPRRIPFFKSVRIFIIDVAILLGLIGLLIGGTMLGKEVIEISKLRSQIAQIAKFDEAVADFYQKFEGLPGDLLAAAAEREGMAYGDGTPGHGDNDGKISPCNLGWEWNLGCETSLFWSHLSAVGLIPQNFSADSRMTDYRIPDVSVLEPYLPESPLGEGIFIAVWNTDAAIEAPAPQLPYGNYYEISRIGGSVEGKLKDDIHALTPAQAHAIDSKMDDGLPLNGRVVVNGAANWPEDAWGTYAQPGENNCITPDKHYNTQEFFKANRPLCHIAIAFTCCKREE